MTQTGLPTEGMRSACTEIIRKSTQESEKSSPHARQILKETPFNLPAFPQPANSPGPPPLEMSSVRTRSPPPIPMIPREINFQPSLPIISAKSLSLN